MAVPKSTQTRLVGIITSTMHASIQFAIIIALTVYDSYIVRATNSKLTQLETYTRTRQ